MERQTSSSVLLVAAFAGGIGFVAFVALMVMGGFTVSPAAFLAILVALVAAIVLFRGFHRGPERDMPNLTPSEDGKLGNALREPGTAGVKPGSASTGGSTGIVPTASPDLTSGRAPTPDHTGNVAGSAPSVGAGGMPTPHGASTSGGAETVETDPGRAMGNAPGSEEGKTPVTEEDTRDAKTASEKADAETTSKDRDAGTASASSATAGEDKKWASTQLDGQTELSERKGDWKFTPDAERGTKAIEGDGEGDSEHSVVEMEPPKLDAPRDGTADDLKKIKGIGPKLEDMLNSMGIYHYDQIAAWSEEELAWVDERLEGFKGRASRDEWSAQAKTLAQG